MNTFRKVKEFSKKLVKDIDQLDQIVYDEQNTSLEHSQRSHEFMTRKIYEKLQRTENQLTKLKNLYEENRDLFPENSLDDAYFNCLTHKFTTVKEKYNSRMRFVE